MIRFKIKKVLLVLSIIFSLLIIYICANAYYVRYPLGYNNVPAYIKCYSGFSSQTLSAVHNSCLAWNSTHTSALVYRNTATHSNTLYPVENGVNEITKGYIGTHTYLMQTKTWCDEYGMYIYEADIDINVSNDFGTASTSYNTQTVMTHEIGHLLGLGESSDTSAIMYQTFAPGEIRYINDDDINGISIIY